MLPYTLHSLLNQICKDTEIIVVDDGSTDDTESHIKPFLSQIQYFRRSHKGRQQARNFGLEQAQGEYVIVCDADIQMKPDCLEKMVAALEKNPEATFAYSSFRWGWKAFPSYPFDAKRLGHMNYINMASLVRREAHPGFDEAIGRLQDWDVWLTIVGKGENGIFIPEQLFSIGEHRGGLSRWLPSLCYAIPWQKLGIRVKSLEEYAHWKEIIQKKHRINQG